MASHGALVKRFQVFNSDWQPLPVHPFDTLDEAKRHILSLMEIYNGPFYVTELNIAYVQPWQAK